MIKIIIKIFIGLLAVAAIAFAGLFFYFNHEIRKPWPGEASKNIVEVKKGETTLQIARKLKERNQIYSELYFMVYARLQKSTLMAGIYKIPENSSLVDVYNLIASGRVTHTKVTIPEGYRAEQIGQVFAENNIIKYEEFVTEAQKNEGFLFPDTYYFPAEGMTVAKVIEEMIKNYNNRTKNYQPAQEDLILASIVEREAVRDDERALIAGVFKNRLKIGMKLDADPTIQYARDNLEIEDLPLEKQRLYKFWRPISLKLDASINSPYNTYFTSGLPPAPICNPGLESIKAAVSPEEHNYYYFLHKDGVIYPSETEEEHNENRAKVLGVKINR